MKIPTGRLKKIIKEELSRVLKEQGSFSSTGPDPKDMLTTQELAQLIDAGFTNDQLSDVDRQSPEVKAVLDSEENSEQGTSVPNADASLAIPISLDNFENINNEEMLKLMGNVGVTFINGSQWKPDYIVGRTGDIVSLMRQFFGEDNPFNADDFLDWAQDQHSPEMVAGNTMNEGIKMPQNLPWEFGPEGYANRPELKQKMSTIEFNQNTPGEKILAIALSNRAEEMINYSKTIDPKYFMSLAKRLYQDYVVGKSGNIGQGVGDITSRIDAGDYFDEEIADVLDVQMKTALDRPLAGINESWLKIAGLV